MKNFINIIKNNEKLFYAISLVIIFTIFSLSYVRHVIMPQQGWWHYYAWRVLEGDILYKDIYLFIPPYFTLLTSLFYKMFSNEFIKYIYFVGYPIKIVSLLIMYCALTKITTPLLSCVSVLLGAFIGATYLSDLLYDYNPVLILPSLLVCWFSMKLYESRYDRKSLKFYAIVLGVLVGILMMSKQTLGVGYFFAMLLFFIILNKRERINNRTIMSAMGFFLIGFAIGITPAIVYFAYYKCLDAFIYCMSIAASSKGGGNGILKNLFKIMTQWDKWMFCIGIYMLINCSALKNMIENIFNNKKKVCLAAFVLCVSIFVLIYSGKLKLSAALLSLVLLPVFLEYLQRKNYIHIDINIPVLCFAILIIGIIIWPKISITYHNKMYYNFHVFGLRRYGIAVISYLFTVIWIKGIISYLKGSQNNIGILVFMSMTFVHFLVGIISSDIFEEVYMLMYIPWGMAYLFNARCSCRYAKNAFLMMVFTISCFMSITSKMVIPYYWQGWCSPPIKVTDMYSSVEGLKGHKLDTTTDKHFLNMVNIIKNNTTNSDAVYQFANIPLFNVLTERIIPTYGVISWFDVLPDDIAIRDAKFLYDNPPKMVVWHNMSEEQWGILERVFRNGKRSGQRAIQQFHDEYVTKNYTVVYKFYNNTDGDIILYKRNKDLL